MVKFSEVRARRERVFYKNRMSGNRERQLEADRKLVEENQHLLPMELRDQLQESTLEDSMVLDEEMEVDMEEKEEVVLKSAMKGKKNKQTRQVKMKVGGGFEAE
jgi:large subunit ribosomal protein L24e